MWASKIPIFSPDLPLEARRSQFHPRRGSVELTNEYLISALPRKTKRISYTLYSLNASKGCLFSKDYHLQATYHVHAPRSDQIAELTCALLTISGPSAVVCGTLKVARIKSGALFLPSELFELPDVRPAIRRGFARGRVKDGVWW